MHNQHQHASSFRSWFVVTIVTTGSLVFGYDSGCMSGALAMADFAERFGHRQDDGTFALGSSNESLITSFLAIGTFIGALAQSYFSDRFGRKWSVVGWACIFVVGAAIQTSSTHEIWQLLIGRLIAGLGVGALSALVTLFAGEVAQNRLCGLMLVLYSVMNAVGLFLAYIISMGSSYASGSASWSVPLGMQIPLGLILIIGMIFIPDSPRRLLYNGKEDKVRQALAFINGIAEHSPEIDDLIRDIEVGIALENEGGQAGWKDLLGKEIRSRVVHGMVLMMFQQLTGAETPCQNYYYVYGSLLFGERDWTDELASASRHWRRRPYFTFVGLYTVDAWGRRLSFFVGSVGMGCCAVIAGLVGHFLLAPDGTAEADLTKANKTGGAVLVAFALLHIAFYNGTSGILPWVYLGETFPTRLRAKAVALGTAANWLWYFLVSFFTPRIVNDIGSLILLIFGGVMLCIQLPYVYFLIRETRGLTLEQVDELYRQKIAPWKSASWQPTTGPRRDHHHRHVEKRDLASETNSSDMFGTHDVKEDSSAQHKRSL